MPRVRRSIKYHPQPRRLGAREYKTRRQRRGGSQTRARSHCRFRSRGIEYVRKSGMKRMSGGAKRRCNRALSQTWPRREAIRLLGDVGVRTLGEGVREIPGSKGSVVPSGIRACMGAPAPNIRRARHWSQSRQMMRSSMSTNLHK
jgi:hypothetical protein